MYRFPRNPTPAAAVRLRRQAELNEAVLEGRTDAPSRTDFQLRLQRRCRAEAK